ncbi:MAG: outer membrane protein assembly factor BamA [Alphaproteobacteria bacterium]
MQKTIYKHLLAASFATGLLFSIAHAETVQQIRVEGNKRIESETVLSYLPLKPGDTYSDALGNKALKDLYATGYFIDVDISKLSNTLVIKVTENAMINRIAFEGNSKLSDDKLKEEVQLRPREVLSQAKIRVAQQRILDLYRRMGRFGAKVEPKIIVLEENRVDLVFEIEEGDVTYIRKVNFIGNHHISANRLESAILSRRAHWYRFFASDDTYDHGRLEADKQALRQFYLNNGFPDFHLISGVAELSPDGKDFYLTFTIDEGELYSFGKIDLVSSIDKINSEDYSGFIDIKEGETFSAKKIEKAITKITSAIGAHGYAFAEIHPSPEMDRANKTVHIKLDIKQGPLAYVERIEIIGNDHTRDHVIRREILLHEGDAYNSTLLGQSETNVRNLGYFKRVEITSKPGSSSDKAIVVVRVEEQSTGELNIAGGYGTMDGAIAKIGYSDRNLGGTGKVVGTEVNVARKYQEFTLGITEPYFLDKPLSLGGRVFANRSNRFETYTHTMKGFNGQFGYDLHEYWSQALIYGFHQDKVFNVKSGSIFVVSQAGKSMTSSVGQQLTFDRRDSKIEPTTGVVATLMNDYAGVGGDIFYFRSVLSGNTYYTPVEDVTFIFKGAYGRIDKINGESIRVVDSFQLGADSLRGFQYGGVGPRDSQSGDGLGGTRYWKASVDALFPIGLPDELGVKGALFADVGNLWKVGANHFNFLGTSMTGLPLGVVSTKDYLHEKRGARVSIGFGIQWVSPFGPLNIDYSFPIRKCVGDQTQNVLFGFTTRF